VRGVDFFGHDARVRLELSSGMAFSARLEGRDLPAVGDDVTVGVLGAALPFPGDAVRSGVGRVPASS
jgi:iron(III) transport system ATP-binding protein